MRARLHFFSCTRPTTNPGSAWPSATEQPPARVGGSRVQEYVQVALCLFEGSILWFITEADCDIIEGNGIPSHVSPFLFLQQLQGGSSEPHSR